MDDQSPVATSLKSIRSRYLFSPWLNDALAIFTPNGDSTLYVDGETPTETLTKKITDGVEDRWGTKSIFNNRGLEVQRIDPQGNITTFTYDDEGWVSSKTDPFGNKWVVEKFATTETSYTMRVTRLYNRSDISDPINTYVDLIWTGYDQTSNYGNLKVVGFDPDGAGPAESLVEKYFYAAGSLIRIEQGTLTSTNQKSYSFGYVGGAGTHLVSTITREDGAIRKIESPLQNYHALGAGFSGTAVALGTVETDYYGNETPHPYAGVTIANLPSEFELDNRYGASTDWNGNRTIIRVDRNNRITQTWDPAQVEAMGLKTMLLSDPILIQRLTLNADLATVYNRYEPPRDSWGDVSSGLNFGEILGIIKPDPDKKVSGDTVQSNGGRWCSWRGLWIHRRQKSIFSTRNGFSRTVC